MLAERSDIKPDDKDRLDTALVLLQAQRHAEAEDILAGLISKYPRNHYLFYLLAEPYIMQNRLDEANALIEKAIQISPNYPPALHSKSFILIQQDNLKEAEKYALEAVRLDPKNAHYITTLANIQMDNEKFKEALETLNKALELEPGNAYARAAYGSALLKTGEPEKSLESFKEALKAEPDIDCARSGMMGALKATNPLCRLFFWDGKLTKKMLLWLAIGLADAALAFKLRDSEMLNLVSYSDAIVFFLFVALAAIILAAMLVVPLQKLILRFSKYGILLMNKDEITSSNLIAGSFCVFFIGCLLCFYDSRFAAVAGFGFAMAFPFNIIFYPSKYRGFLRCFASALALIGLAAIADIFYTGEIMIMSFFTILFVIFMAIAKFLFYEENSQ